MEKLNLDKKNLKKFGITMGAALFIIALLLVIRHKYDPKFIFLISVIFFLLSFIAPALLKLAYIPWMKLASILGWINTRLILFIIFYLIFTPIGFVLRLFGADLLDRKIDKNKDSYWKMKEKKSFNPLDYKRQF